MKKLCMILLLFLFCGGFMVNAEGLLNKKVIFSVDTKQIYGFGGFQQEHSFNVSNKNIQNNNSTSIVIDSSPDKYRGQNLVIKDYNNLGIDTYNQGNYGFPINYYTKAIQPYLNGVAIRYNREITDGILDEFGKAINNEYIDTIQYPANIEDTGIGKILTYTKEMKPVYITIYLFADKEWAKKKGMDTAINSTILACDYLKEQFNINCQIITRLWEATNTYDDETIYIKDLISSICNNKPNDITLGFTARPQNPPAAGRGSLKEGCTIIYYFPHYDINHYATVVLHEMGHNFGLEHCSVNNCTMYPAFYGPLNLCNNCKNLLMNNRNIYYTTLDSLLSDAFDQDNYELAIEYLNKIIKNNPKDAGAYFDRGLAYLSLGKYDQAIADYNKVIKINPNNAGAYNNRGLAYYGLGKYNRAIADYNKAIELDPNDALYYNNRGNAYDKIGRNIRATADHNKACELSNRYCK